MKLITSKDASSITETRLDPASLDGTIILAKHLFLRRNPFYNAPL
ncbi:MAG: hypothetical protein K0S89_410 [Nitrososphaeraceae archaeon]|jgi:hypothetical protein|nr:hypothetical protein [Nitrososphaeraceae archaeon]